MDLKLRYALAGITMEMVKSTSFHRFSGAGNRGSAERVHHPLLFPLELLPFQNISGLHLSRPSSGDRFNVPAADIELLQNRVVLACLSVLAAGLSRFLF